MARQRFTYRCAECGGTNVLHDAWAVWSEQAQTFELHGDPFDHTHCEDCDGECHAERIAIE